MLNTLRFSTGLQSHQNLNPIENIWSIHKHAVYSRNSRDINELKMHILEEIAKLDS